MALLSRKTRKMSVSENNSRMARNTLILYLRMFLNVFIGLISSRLILNKLGINDFGILTVVGGIVSLFGFFSNAMTSSAQRFMAVDLGRNDFFKLRKTFNAIMKIQLTLGVLIVFFSETIGFWMVNNYLNIPLERMCAVNWVYQFAVVTFLIAMVQVPFDALIIVKEHLKVYAFFSVTENLLKLLAIFSLTFFDFDNMIMYSLILMLLTVCLRFSQFAYCKYQFQETKYVSELDKEFYGHLLSFTGWNLFGNIAGVAKSQGINVLINVFFGTALNAAYGVGMQVQNVAQSFVSNFQLATAPQIVKYHASGDSESSNNLILNSARYTFFLLYIIAIPVIFNIDVLLRIWLKEIPEFTGVFVKLGLINLLIEVISGPLMIGAQASGNIKWYQITIGTMIFVNLPVSYVLLFIYKNPFLIYDVSISISILSLLLRLFFLERLINLSIRKFLIEVMIKIFLVSLFSLLPIFFFRYWLELRSINVSLILLIIFDVVICIMSIFIFGLQRSERKYLYGVVINYFVYVK